MTSEDKIQSDVYRWFNNNYCLNHHNPKGIIFSVPNGGTRNIIEATKLKATGLTPGVSDLILIYNHKILFLELKNEIGRQSTAQIQFQNAITQNGFNYQIAYSLEQAKELIITHFL